MSNPVLLVVVPLLGAFLVPLLYRFRQVGAGAFGPLLLIATLVIALHEWQLALRFGPFTVNLGGFAPPIGIALQIDAMSAVFIIALLVAGLLLWPRGNYDRAREDSLTLLLMGSGAGVALAADLFNLYVFYELLAFASFGLIATRGTGTAFAATLRFLILSALGTALALLGIALVYAATGTLSLPLLAEQAPAALSSPLGTAAFVLMLIGFGVKAELFPVNTWVPEVYSVAPARVSALLAGVVSKLALLAILHVLVQAFQATPAASALLVVGVLGVISGELSAWRAPDLRRVLGYSSVAQLGLAAIAFALPDGRGMLAGLVIALHHLLIKPAFFLLAETWGGPLRRLAGAAATSRLGAALFVLLALSLVGVPPLPGFWGKYLLIMQLVGGGGWHIAVALLVLIATVIEAAYLFRIVHLLYQPAPSRVRAPAIDALFPAGVIGAVLLSATILTVPLSHGLTDVTRASIGVHVAGTSPTNVAAGGDP